jgi:hypothetical protein
LLEDRAEAFAPPICAQTLDPIAKGLGSSAAIEQCDAVTGGQQPP